MNKFSKISLVLLVGLSLVIAGCGGGGGNSTPKPKNVRIISGKIVSSVKGVGVANVKVTLGNTAVFVISDKNGAFKFSVSVNGSIPTFVKVDTAGAGNNFPSGGVVTFNNQKYVANFIDIPIDVLNGITESMGNITIYDISDNVPPPPFADKNTLISGRIVSTNTGLGVSNVTFAFGKTSKVQAMSGALGYFAINLGKNAEVKTFYPDAISTFAVDTATAGSAFPNTLPITLNSTNYQQKLITVPSELVNGDTTVLGVLYIRDDSGGGGENPPPPPPNGGGGDNPPPPPGL